MANQNQETFVHIDARTAADMRRRGMDPHQMEQATRILLYNLYTSLPAPPVSAAACLSALPSASSNGEDRISSLPFALLREIVSRLPVKDAVRTAVLSRRWHLVWLCSPLVFTDAHLIPGFIERRGRTTRVDTLGLVAAVKRVLAAHPGPFRSVHLVCGYMDAHQRQLARWVQTLADKGITDLVLVNRPWPLDNRDLDFLLAGSPVLEVLGIQGANTGCASAFPAGKSGACRYASSIAVVDTPSLERLLIRESMTREGSFIRIKIGNAPNLRLLGYLNPGIHMLEIRNTVITAGIRASPSTMAPSVKILGLHSPQ
nr:unnamed protein product [Digitaria exilis]